MKILDSLGDQLINDPTVAGSALTNRSEVVLDPSLLESFANCPALNTVANPALLSVCRCNEDSSFAPGMMQQESPFCFQLGDVSVVDLNGSEGIHDYYACLVENHLGSYPQDVGNGCEHCAQAKVDRQHAALAWVCNGLGQEHGVENEGENGPSQIALGRKI